MKENLGGRGDTTEDHDGSYVYRRECQDRGIAYWVSIAYCMRTLQKCGKVLPH